MAGKTNKKGRRIKIGSLLLAALIIYMSVAIISQQSKLNSLNGEIASMNEQIAEKNREVQAISDEEAMCESDEYIERTAREKLGFVRSDETVFVDVTGK